jgi:HlyD family secretion protein
VEAALARARWAVEQKTQSAPTAGRIQDTLYRPGEFVPAGSPVLVLLPPENIKTRFFVPETELSSVKVGQLISVSFDGATAPLRATINYVSAQPEFTPPVIYSQQTRAKLVFLVEAAFAPADAVKLHPGQPVEVRLNP